MDEQRTNVRDGTANIVGEVGSPDLPNPNLGGSKSKPAKADAQDTATEVVMEEDGLPVLRNVAVEKASQLGLAVIDAVVDGSYLFLTVKGDNVEDVQGPEARRLAYDVRFKYGFESAGIEPYGGASIDQKSKKYRQVWKLTKAMV